METTCYDMSGGDSHIREIAEESGIDFLSYHSHEKTEIHHGYEVETWYDEDASSALSAWGAFIKGVGSCSAESKEQAIFAIVNKAIKSV